MKITILTTSFPEYPGDLAGIFIEHFAHELTRQSLQVRVIAPHSPNTPKHELLDHVQVKRFQYFYPAKWQRVSYGYGIPANVKASLWAKLGLLPFLGTFFLAALRHKNTTDVYHAHWIVSGFVALLGQWIHHKPIVLTVRGSDLNLFRGKLFTPVFRYIFRRVAAITTVSKILREKVLALGIAPEKVHLIPNGVDCFTFRPLPRNEVRRKLQLPSERIIVLWIGRFVAIKGVEFLIQAIPEVMSSKPNVLFVLVGTGELENALKAHVHQMGLSDAVMFAGKIVQDQIPLWLNAADILVLPSLNEGRPNVILEAMACEIPVVATAVGGIPEIVHDHQNGFLVAPKDSVALAERLITLSQNNSLRKQMGTTGRKMIFEMGLSWEQCARQMDDIYQRVAAHYTSDKSRHKN